MIHLLPHDYCRMPWRNGGGFTTEIARQDGTDGDLDWRVSIADVTTDGPFSSFPGCDRTIVVIAGAGMRLAHASDAPVTVAPLAPHAFDGDVETRCTLLAGPVRDFNLIARRARWQGGVLVLRAALAGETPLAAGAVLVHCLEGRLVVGDGNDHCVLGAGETVRALAGEAPLASCRRDTVAATALVATLVPRGAAERRDDAPSR